MKWDECICAIFRRVGKFPGAERIAMRLVPQEHFTPERRQDIVLDGIRLTVCPRSRVGWNLFVFGEYDRQLRAIMRSCIKEGAVVIDAGANIGWHALYAAKLVGSKGRVHAFEPNPHVRQELQRHIESNRLPNIQIWEYALSDRRGQTQFEAPAASSLLAGDGKIHSSSTDAAVGTVEVETIPLDETQIEFERVDFIKIDVEGHELPLMRGAAETIKRFKPLVAFEFISGSDRDAKEIADLLRPLGYEFYSYNDRQSLKMIDSLVGYYGDFLALPRDYPAKSRLLG